MRRRTATGDAGQAMLPLLVVVALSLLICMFYLLVPWGAATTEKASAQTAADAAALAAVGDKREAWVASTRPGLTPADGTLPGFTLATGLATARDAQGSRGCGQASEYARRNDAVVVACDVVRRRGRVAVELTVQLLTTSQPDRDRAQATAVASMDIDFDRCVWDVVVPPLTLANGGPVSFPGTLRCGVSDVGYEFDNAPPYPSSRYNGTTERRIHNDLVPRLVSNRP